MSAPPTASQLRTLLDPQFLGRTVGAFYRRRKPKGLTKGELLSEAADFVLTRYDMKTFSKKKANKKNDAKTALMAHAAVSIYNRLLRVCEERRSEYLRQPIPLPLLPFELASEDKSEREEAIKRAEYRMELLEAVLEFDRADKAAELREVIRLFREKENFETVAVSMGMSGYRLHGLFRWAARRYRSLLN